VSRYRLRVRTRRPIYVESRIRAPMDQLWDATQQPSLHRRWDVRFGTIDYQPTVDGEPQRFTYATTIAPGVTIGGTGESLGDRNRPDGTRWSGLKFWADDWRSIIAAGAGYWRYVPTDDGIRFLTRFDYRPRWGRAGELVDRHLFRPVFGWATSWSFDRLRLWLEHGIPPERARDQAVAHGASIAGLAGVWLYQGLVPKLWRVDSGEVALWMSALGLGRRAARGGVRAAGIAEVVMGVAAIARARQRWPAVVTAVAMPLLTTGAWRADRNVITRAFNPVALSTAMVAMAITALATRADLPSGRTPLRAAPDRQPDVGELP
jgi:DoxX-like family